MPGHPDSRSWKLNLHNTMAKRLAVYGSAPTDPWKTNNVKVLLVTAFIATAAIIILCLYLFSEKRRKKRIERKSGTQADANV
jgi:hypothetical protein